MNKFYKVLLWTFFAIYLFILLYVTFFGGRTRMFENMSSSEYLSLMVNLVPFKTISLYFKWLMDGQRSNNYVPLTNLGVNIILLFPMGLFLPELFKKLKNFFIYLLSCVLILAVIETFQLVLRRGSFDVDDFILNILGAVMGFFVCRLIEKIVNAVKNRKTERNKDV